MLKKNQIKSRKKNTEQIKKMEASENLFNKQFKDIKEIFRIR